MAGRTIPTKDLSRRSVARTSQPSASRASLKNGKEELDKYIEEFISNGIKLQEELMVNHDAIRAAKREYLTEFRRKRQLG